MRHSQRAKNDFWLARLSTFISQLPLLVSSDDPHLWVLYQWAQGSIEKLGNGRLGRKPRSQIADKNLACLKLCGRLPHWWHKRIDDRRRRHLCDWRRRNSRRHVCWKKLCHRKQRGGVSDTQDLSPSETVGTVGCLTPCASSCLWTAKACGGSGSSSSSGLSSHRRELRRRVELKTKGQAQRRERRKAAGESLNGAPK